MTASITHIPLGPLQTNGYLLTSNGHAVMIDPGGDTHLVLAELQRQKVVLDAIWLTHAHFDHVGGIAELRAAHNVPVRMHEDGAVLLRTAGQSARGYGLPFTDPPTDFEPIEVGARLHVGNTEVHALFTPGHAPGHIAFYVPSSDVVFSGDALFQGSIGRTDLPLANHETLIASIVNELLTLPDHTVVLSGHGPPTTIGEERQLNPFLPRNEAR